jgi:hypothetical protein
MRTGMVTRNFTMTLYAWLVVSGMLLSLTAGRVYAQSILYDDFQGILRLDKWVGQQVGEGGMEVERKIQRGKLLMSHRVLGDTEDSEGRNISTNQLLFQEGRTLTAVRFDMVVQDVNVRGCSAPRDKDSFIHAGFFAALFRDDRGDTRAAVFVDRQSDSEAPPNRLRVIGEVVRCLNADCSSNELEKRNLGTVTLGERFTLQLVWEEINQRVRFRMNNEDFVSIPYTQDVVALRPFKILYATGAAANCRAGRPLASVSVLFDNVFYSP